MKDCNECKNYGKCPFYVKGKGVLIGKRIEMIEDGNEDCFSKLDYIVTPQEKKGIEIW